MPPRTRTLLLAFRRQAAVFVQGRGFAVEPALPRRPHPPPKLRVFPLHRCALLHTPPTDGMQGCRHPQTPTHTDTHTGVTADALTRQLPGVRSAALGGSDGSRRVPVVCSGHMRQCGAQSRGVGGLRAPCWHCVFFFFRNAKPCCYGLGRCWNSAFGRYCAAVLFCSCDCVYVCMCGLIALCTATAVHTALHSVFTAENKKPRHRQPP